MKAKKWEYKSSWRILSYPQPKLRWFCVCYKGNSCSGLQIPAPPVVPLYGERTLQMPPSVFLKLSQQTDWNEFLQSPWKDCEPNLFTWLWNLTVSGWVLSCSTEGKWFMLIFAAAGMAVHNPQNGMLAELVELCHLMAELEQSTKNRAGQVAVAVSRQQDKCQRRGSCYWLYFNWKWREWGNNIPSLFIYPVCPAFPYLSGAALCALLVLPTLSHCSGSRRQSPDFNFFTVPPFCLLCSVSPFPCLKWELFILKSFTNPNPLLPFQPGNTPDLKSFKSTFLQFWHSCSFTVLSSFLTWSPSSWGLWACSWLWLQVVKIMI